MQFYLLEDSEQFRKADWDAEQTKVATVICPNYAGHQHPGNRTDTLAIILPAGRTGDFIWTSLSECVITDRVVEIFTNSSLTGFKLESVNVSKAKSRGGTTTNIPKLWELKVTGWGGMAGLESGIHLLEECKSCGTLAYSTYTDASKLIDPAKWDGSDIFMVWPLPRYVFVSARLRDVVENAQLTGCRFVEVEKLSSPITAGMDKLVPGRLSYYMPMDRAVKLGGNIGIV